MSNTLSKEFLEAFGNKSHKLLGEYKKPDTRTPNAVLEYRISELEGKINAARVGGAGNIKKLKEEQSRLKHQLQEAKMSDDEVLKAAKSLASNGKDEKTKKFGQGLVDFYKKNKSFTPDQVSGLQNIMKNASFQMAKEEVDLDEARSISMDDVQALDRIPDIKDLQMKAVEINNNSAASARKKAALTNDIMKNRSKDKILSVVWNTVLAGDKLGVVGSSYGKRMKEDVDLEEAAKYAKDKEGKSDDGEGLDPVDKKAVKKDFDNRKDKDLDNDGDSDESDEYLHKKRKAISKNIKEVLESIEEDEDIQLDEARNASIKINGTLEKIGRSPDPGADTGWASYNKYIDFIKKYATKKTRYRRARGGARTATTTLDVDGYEIKHRYREDIDDYNRGSYSHEFSGSKEAINHLKTTYFPNK